MNVPRQDLPTVYVDLFIGPGQPHWAIVIGPKEDFDGKTGRMYHAIKTLGAIPPQGGPAPGIWSIDAREPTKANPTGGAYSTSPQMLVRMVIAKIKPNMLEKVCDVLKAVPVVQNTPGWNCLSWLEAALQALKLREPEFFSMAFLGWSEVKAQGSQFYVDKMTAGHDWVKMPMPTYDLLEHKDITKPYNL